MELRTDRFKFKELFPEKAKKYAQKLHIKADEIEFVRKGIPIDPKDIEIKEGERAAIRYVTTPHLDRDSEILIPTGAILDDFRQSPSVLYAHDYKGLPIGKDLWVKPTAKGILAKTQYAKHQFAEDVYQCVKGKFLNSNSVGFIPVESVKPDDKKAFAELQNTLEKDFEIPKKESGKAKNIYTKWIMLEHSDVPVASNAQSLNLAVSKGDLPIQSERLKKDLEIEVVKDIKEVEIEFERVALKAEAEKIDREILVEKDEEKEFKGVTAEWREGKEADYMVDDKGDIITKPETTENYHRIPIESPAKHKGHRIRTITISASKGIKALYCGECKRVITYLFDVDKFSMAEAQAWVNEHKRELGECIHKYFTAGIVPKKEEYKEIIKSIIKEADKKLFKETYDEPQYKERWNKSFSKLFDIASAESSAPMRFHFDLYEKFLECKVKEVFQNTYTIPSPLMGSYLAAFKDILGKFDLKDTRRFSWAGDETPPNYEVVQLNSEKSDDFLIDGMQFYEAEKRPLIVNYSPDWYGITITLITSTTNKKWNKDLLDKVHAWVQENNFLRGEKFALSGEFLKEPGDNWDNLILKDKYKDAIMMSAKALEKKGEKLVGRGLLFIGPPGTGKTKTGRVLMNELDATFIWVSSRDFRHIGPLRALAIGFSMARDLAPSVLFLEDIDTWLRGEMEFVTDSLKTEMDGIKQNRGMVTIMTSNYPEKLPPALLDRPGRFHHIVNFELPDEEQRKEMIELWADDIDEKLLDELGEKTDGFSGAHLKELVEFAKMIAEEEEIEIGDAILLSLDKLMEQRELIEEIRANVEDAKEFWGKLKYAPISGIFVDLEKKEALRADVSNELEEGKGVAIGANQQIDLLKKICDEMNLVVVREGEEVPWNYDGFIYLGKSDNFKEEDKHSLVKFVKEQYEKLLQEKDEHMADLKEGRVLSRKNRKIVKDAITALNAVLKADATGSREDEESEGGGTVTEREVEIERESEREFSKEEIAKVVKEVSGEQMGEILKDAFEKALDPEKMKAMVGEGIKLELDKLRGKVT